MSFSLELRTTKFALFGSSSPNIYEINLSFMGHLLAPNANSPECRDLIRSWLRECSMTHNHACDEMTEKPLPKRITVVPRALRHPMKLKRVCAGEMGRYVVLSHCWGSGIDFVATSANIAALEKEIPFQKLCTNFQDAINVTRNQGFQYLWIDALCILQDSREEWAEQSALMAQIYQRSAFMISAAAATQPQDGFLMNRPLGVARSPTFGKLNNMVLETTNRVERNAAIDTRAWCYQERIMAPRIVRFEESRLRWECNGIDWREDDGNRKSGGLLGGTFKKTFSLFLKPDSQNILLSSTAKNSAGSLNESANKRVSAWYQTLWAYNNRSLTIPTDKFPAISGLAAALSTQEMGQYLAGLWERNFFFGLSWEAMEFERYDEVYIAPTWSWASIKGNFTSNFGSAWESMKPVSTIWKSDFGPRLVNRDIKLVTQNPYGQVAHGSTVTIEGFCGEITTCFIKNLYQSMSKQPAYFEWPASEKRSWSFASKNGRAILQDEFFDPLAPVRQVTCLQINYLMTGFGLKEQPTLVLLLIEPVEADHACFRRVGILFIQNKNLCPGSPLWDALLDRELWKRRTFKLI